MRKLHLLGMTVVAIVFASCGSEKQMTNNQPQQQNQRMQEGVSIVMPCVDVSYDDDDYYRDLGIGTALNPQMARKAAVKEAQSMVRERLNGVVKGLATDYSRSVSGNASADKVQGIIENEFTTVIDQMLNNADKVCEDLVKLQDGNYRAYYAIQISKKEIVNKATEAISQEEEWGIEFKRDQFRKYAEEYLEKQGNK
ncbi:MAG: hypothetical protein IJK92_00020 [Bacteroidales bacterium]|nr:hypothetical protein [Bacteroidales bacterium]